jgi:hypothetical protein
MGASGHELRIRTNTLAAGRPQTTDPPTARMASGLGYDETRRAAGGEAAHAPPAGAFWAASSLAEAGGQIPNGGNTGGLVDGDTPAPITIPIVRLRHP